MMFQEKPKTSSAINSFYPTEKYLIHSPLEDQKLQKLQLMALAM